MGSKADEMFRKLEFNKVVDNEKELRYEYKNKILGDVLTHNILFAKVGKIIFSYNDDIKKTIGISIQELQAINQKCLELGWIK